MSRQANYYTGATPPLIKPQHQQQMPTGHFNQYHIPGPQQQPMDTSWNSQQPMNWQQQPAANSSIPQHMPNVQQIPVPQQLNSSNFFDNTSSADSWGDFGDGDWNDNTQSQHPLNYVPNQSNNVGPPSQTHYGQTPHYQQVQPQSPFQSPQNNDQVHLQHLFSDQPPIADSFRDNSNWNWNVGENKSSVSSEPVFKTVGKDAVLKHSTNPTNTSEMDPTAPVDNFQNNLPRPPDTNRITQLNNPAMHRILKSERLLTPQWSTESQMSHTSSDRSIDSDAMNSRSTTSSDDPNHHQHRYGYHENNQQTASNFGVENENSHLNYNLPKDSKEESVDKLDEVLFALNANSQAADSSSVSQINPIEAERASIVIESNSANNFDFTNPPAPVNYQSDSSLLFNQPSRPSSVSNLPPPPAFQEQSRITSSPMNNFSQPTSSPMILPPPSLTQSLARKNSSPMNQPQLQPTPPPQINQSLANSAFSSEYTGMLPPPPLQQSQRKNSSPSSLPSTQLSSQFTASSSTGSENPFKRTGAHVHNKNIFHSDTMTSQPMATAMPPQFSQFPSHEFNQQHPPPDNSEIIDQTPASNRHFMLHENQELAANNDRNQYLQTGHLSEEPFVPSDYQSTNYEQNDNLPPPGLSRLVLGQPEFETHHTHPTEPPPGLARMIPGTELVNSTPLNLDRQADGQDTIPHLSSIRSVNVTSYPSQQQQQPPQQQHHSHSAVNILDRNLYLVPGESDEHTQRVVTGGLEREEQPRNAHDVSVVSLADEERELIMDGENLEDDNQISRDDPIEGANTGDENQSSAANSNLVDNEQIVMPIDPSKKFNSNPSTCNDDSDKDRSTHYRSRRGDELSGNRRRRDKNNERYETEDTDYYSDRDRNRGRFNREGSVRKDPPRRSKERGDRDEWSKENRDRYRDDRNRQDGERYRGERSRQERYSRYETDGSRYETEDSRYERQQKRRVHDDSEPRSRREESDRRYRRSDRGDRSDRGERTDRQNESIRNDRYKADRDPSDRKRDKNRSSDSYYDEDHYRRTGSRNAIDREKDGRYAGQNYYQQGYGYDQYSYYQQQQYYETLRRTNPQAYAEWYKMYYSQMQQVQMSGNAAATATDGRESVHSGRSSANDQERYSRSSNHQQMYYDPNLYQRQFSQQQNSTMLDNSNYIGDRDRLNTQSLSRQHSFTQPYNVYADTARTDAGQTVQQSQQRLTPCKFTVDHSVASISNGLMVCVKPQFSSNEFSKVVKVFSLGVNDSTRKLYQIYPGPLIRGTTHKKTIIEFCEEQIRLGPSMATLKSRSNSMSSLYSLGQANKSSYTLMWNLLILLLRQNGVVVGTDISELLLKNKSDFPYEAITRSSMNSLHSRRNSGDSEKIEFNQDGSDGSNEIDDSESKKSLSESEITEKFRNYLLYGNVNEALDWATDNNLWGHALFLASKVDRRSHANVMMKFANKLALNDPLQTLYQLMSGRTPSSVTSIQDEKWGDWRPHLAMILANTSQKPELDRKAITTLGDSLYNRGDLFAAQFCYLMAQVGFGKYSSVSQETGLMLNTSNAIRLILLGSSHRKPFKEFATNEAIMMTEIYEYACALNDDSFSIIDFQPFKFLLATRMIDYGMHVKALLYLEQISNHIQKNLSKYEAGFIQRIYTLADQLKYFDTMFDRNGDDASNFNDDGANYSNASSNPDQQWLQNLCQTVQQIGVNQQTPTIPIHNDELSYPSMEIKTQIDHQFDQINKQFSALNLQYAHNYGLDPMTTAVNQPSSVTDFAGQQNYGLLTGTVDSNYNPYDNGQPDSMGTGNSMTYINDQEYVQQPQYDQVTNEHSDYWNQEPSHEQLHTRDTSHSPSLPSIESVDPVPEVSMPPQSVLRRRNNVRFKNVAVNEPCNQSKTANSLAHTKVSDTVTPKMSVLKINKKLSRSVKKKTGKKVVFNGTFPIDDPISSRFNENRGSSDDDDDSEDDYDDDENEESECCDRGVSIEELVVDRKVKLNYKKMMSEYERSFAAFDQLMANRNLQHIRTDFNIPKPSISMPNSISNKPGFYNDDPPPAASSVQNKQQNSSEEARKEQSNANKAQSHSANSNSGWFGGIWNKLSLKPKNQMILPDDKNPSIVWDPDNKKWVNTDGETEETEQFRPPPKMTDFVTNQQSQNVITPPTTQSAMHEPFTNPHPASTNLLPAATGFDVPLRSNMSGGETTKVPNLQSNMFKMQRNRTLKKSYVDVFNPSGAPSKPIEPIMAPTVPVPSMPQSGYFVPGSVPAGEGQQLDNSTHFYNPAQHGAGGFQQ